MPGRSETGLCEFFARLFWVLSEVPEKKLYVISVTVYILQYPFLVVIPKQEGCLLK